LSYLTFLPLDKIKIDRSLIIEFLEIKNLRVMESLISLAHSLELTVIAEGVETAEQLKRLQMCQCDTIQGFYFSKPLAPSEIAQNYYKNYYSESIDN
jgi:EAL domain-containing protein (putative c-di-GMP-specific phosphodiesterase class I)